MIRVRLLELLLDDIADIVRFSVWLGVRITHLVVGIKVLTAKHALIG